MASTDTEQKPEEPVETTGSMLDMSQAAVKKMIAQALLKSRSHRDHVSPAAVHTVRQR